MNITIRQLQVFRTAALLGSFTRAAKHLHLTTPAVSKQIRKLESECKLHLFEQSGRCVNLTQQGKRLLEQAAQVDNEMKLLKQMVRDESVGSEVSFSE